MLTRVSDQVYLPGCRPHLFTTAHPEAPHRSKYWYYFHCPARQRVPIRTSDSASRSTDNYPGPRQGGDAPSDLVLLIYNMQEQLVRVDALQASSQSLPNEMRRWVCISSRGLEVAFATNSEGRAYPQMLVFKVMAMRHGAYDSFPL